MYNKCLFSEFSTFPFCFHMYMVFRVTLVSDWLWQGEEVNQKLDSIILRTKLWSCWGGIRLTPHPSCGSYLPPREYSPALGAGLCVCVCAPGMVGVGLLATLRWLFHQDTQALAYARYNNMKLNPLQGRPAGPSDGRARLVEIRRQVSWFQLHVWHLTSDKSITSKILFKNL